jgi:zinc transporter, ZIP family
MHPAVFLPFFSTLAGGFAALRLQHRLHSLMALAAGVVVATAIADLLPEAMELAGPDRILEVGIAAVVGFIGFSFLEAFLHQSSFEHARDRDHDHDGDHDHGTEHGGRSGARVSPDERRRGLPAGARRPGGTGLLGLLPPASLVLHSAMDGLAIGLAFQAGDRIGLVVLVAVLLHDFADGMNVATVALDAARGERLAVGFVVLDAVAAPAGGLLSTVVTVEDATLGLMLAAFAGVFLAIGAGHLLPESQHRDPGHGPALVALAGVGAAVVLAVRAIAH